MKMCCWQKSTELSAFKFNMHAANIFGFHHRYLRSVHLERDWRDESALANYVLTDQAKDVLARLAGGLAPNSGQRAWRLTGNYGSGKSSLALLLAHIFSSRVTGLTPRLQEAVDWQDLKLSAPNLLPVLVTGSRESIGTAVARALHGAVSETCLAGRPPRIIGELEAALINPAEEPPSDRFVLEALQDATEHVTGAGKAGGLLLILDELGKFLEHAARWPDEQDIHLLQAIAEMASRSGQTPIVVVGLLHQGFGSYSVSLGRSEQKEWEKVAGRFEEILWNPPLDQIFELAVGALAVQVKFLDKDLVRRAKSDMESALRCHWYGTASEPKSIAERAACIYPLHPTVLPPLVRLFNSFGQNERSLFNFLLGNEPLGLRELTGQLLAQKEFFRLHHLYDYARANLDAYLNNHHRRTRWHIITDIVDRFSAASTTELHILKTIGILNVLDQDGLTASDEILNLALGDNLLDGSDLFASRVDTRVALENLRTRHGIIYQRGASRGYCLWRHSSVNLEGAYMEAAQELGEVPRVTQFIGDLLQVRPLVARRHYITTGNLRHFEVLYCSVDALADALRPCSGSDGRLIIALCETEPEQQQAMEFARGKALAERPELLLALTKPLRGLCEQVQELRRWKSVQNRCGGLVDDPFAANEVQRRIRQATRELEAELEARVGLRGDSHALSLEWFSRCEPQVIAGGKELLKYLSTLCDELFPKAPVIQNELINRRSLTSSAAGARQRLFERLFTHGSEPRLGMVGHKRPPELAMYLSVLSNTGLHGGGAADCGIHLPQEDFDARTSRVRPALDRIYEILVAQAERRVCVEDVFSQLRLPPYGMRDGLIPIFLAVFSILHREGLAYYEDGSFIPEVDGGTFQRLSKAPGTFEVQYCNFGALRGDLFSEVARAFGVAPSPTQEVHLLDVARVLLTSAATLPLYTRKTALLSPVAKAVREALYSAREPAGLIFDQLPRACGFAAFREERPEDVPEFTPYADTLRSALDELQGAYLGLRARIGAKLAKSFGFTSGVAPARAELAARAGVLAAGTTEIRLRGFCLRLLDLALTEEAWLESIGGFVSGTPPSKWSDDEEQNFVLELGQLCARFQRLESILQKTNGHSFDRSAIRMSLTAVDGSEREEIVFLSEAEQADTAALEVQLDTLLSCSGRVGLAAASRALWKILPQTVEASAHPRTP